MYYNFGIHCHHHSSNQFNIPTVSISSLRDGAKHVNLAVHCNQGHSAVYQRERRVIWRTWVTSCDLTHWFYWIGKTRNKNRAFNGPHQQTVDWWSDRPGDGILIKIIFGSLLGKGYVMISPKRTTRRLLGNWGGKRTKPNNQVLQIEVLLLLSRVTFTFRHSLPSQRVIKNSIDSPWAQIIF